LLTTRLGSARTRSTGTPIAPLPKTSLGTRRWGAQFAQVPSVPFVKVIAPNKSVAGLGFRI
jgi:hypothetical protein